MMFEVGSVLTIENSWLHMLPSHNSCKTIESNETGEMYRVCRGRFPDQVLVLQRLTVDLQTTPAGIATDPRFD